MSPTPNLIQKAQESWAVPIVRHAHGHDLPLPFYATPGSSGLDLCAAILHPVSLLPGERALVPSGISLSLPCGLEAQLRPRSGLGWKHGVCAMIGTIDSDYVGEVKVILMNHSPKLFVVERGMRIAQLVIARVEKIKWNEVSSLQEASASHSVGSSDNKKTREKSRTGGFGSTGLL